MNHINLSNLTALGRPNGWATQQRESRAWDVLLGHALDSNADVSDLIEEAASGEDPDAELWAELFRDMREEEDAE